MFNYLKSIENRDKSLCSVQVVREVGMMVSMVGKFLGYGLFAACEADDNGTKC